MLTKILFTIVVIIGVIIFFRNKQTNANAARPRPAPATATAEQGGSISTRTLAYGLIAVLVAISLLVFVISWHSSNRIVNIRVISDGGTSMNYQARHKSIKGKSFVTLEGTQVTLGESDRVEMIEQ
jgi:hypothetical protein